MTKGTSAQTRVTAAFRQTARAPQQAPGKNAVAVEQENTGPNHSSQHGGRQTRSASVAELPVTEEASRGAKRKRAGTRGSAADADADADAPPVERTETGDGSVPLTATTTMASIETTYPASVPESELSEDDVSEHVRALATAPAHHNIDEDDEGNPQQCTTYINDIIANAMQSQFNFFPPEAYLDTGRQPDITAQMRAILVDWLVEVMEEYNLCSETLYLAVNILDRFLGRQDVNRSRLQLVGVTCMLLASKYEEIYAPCVEEFVYITDSTYTREEILQMESKILSTVHFRLTVPTAKFFLRRFLKAAEANSKTTMYANFLGELTLLEYAFIKYPPSLLSAAIVAVARASCVDSAWSPTLQHYTGYELKDLRDCATFIHGYVRASEANQRLPAVRERYNHPNFLEVAKIPATLPTF